MSEKYIQISQTKKFFNHLKSTFGNDKKERNFKDKFINRIYFLAPKFFQTKIEINADK